MKNIVLKGCIVVFTVAFFWISAPAQTTYRSLTWGYDEGVPTQSRFYHIMQEDDGGYLWFATSTGVIRFDGIDFSLFDTENSDLPANFVRTLFKDSKKRLWYGSGTDGFGTFLSDTTLVFSKPGYIRGYEETPEGVLWVATDGNGLWKVDLRKDAATRQPRQVFFEELGIYILDLFVGRNGDLHVATVNGIFTIRGDRLITYPQTVESPVYSVWADSSGEIWYGNEQGLHQLKGDRPEPVRFTSPPPRPAVIQIIEHPNEEMLVLTDQALYTLQEDRLVPVYEAEEQVLTCLTTDHEGNIWIGTEIHGIIQLIPSNISTIDKDDGLPGSLTTVVTQGRDGTVYVGTTSGLAIMDASDTTIEILFEESMITSVLSDDQNRTWVALRGQGLRLLDENEVQSFTAENGLLSTAVWTLYQDKQGKIWAGGATGIMTYSEEEGWQEARQIQEKLMNSDVRVIRQTSAGDLWVGTSYGLHAFMEDTTHVYTTYQGLKSAVILDIVETSDNMVWIATMGGGLYRFSGNELKPVPETVTGSDIVRIIPVGEDLWLAGNKGITGVNLRALNDGLDGNGNFPDVIRFERSDELPGEIFGTVQPSGWYKDNGELWFPTTRGMVRFRPEVEKLQPPPPPIKINYVIVGVDTLYDPANLEIPHTRDRIDISYTAFSYANPGAVTYSYRLADFDEDWSDVGSRRTAVYTNLPPGDYKFEVTARIGDGPRSTLPASVPVTIIPAFYETFWFRASVAVGILLIMWGAYAWRINALKRLEQLRVRIANDLHDEIGSNLGSIALRSRMLSRRTTSEEEQKNLMEIDRISRQTAVGMRDIIWLINPEKDQMEDLQFKLKQIASQLLVDIPFKFYADTQSQKRALSLHTRRNTVFIFKEILHNIIKHSGAEKVEIRLSHQAGKLILFVSDNGRGFDPSGIDGEGIGLKSINKRCDEINARLQIDSSPAEGTRFDIRIPIT